MKKIIFLIFILYSTFCYCQSTLYVSEIVVYTPNGKTELGSIKFDYQECYCLFNTNRFTLKYGNSLHKITNVTLDSRTASHINTILLSGTCLVDGQACYAIFEYDPITELLMSVILGDKNYIIKLFIY